MKVEGGRLEDLHGLVMMELNHPYHFLIHATLVWAKINTKRGGYEKRRYVADWCTGVFDRLDPGVWLGCLRVASNPNRFTQRESLPTIGTEAWIQASVPFFFCTYTTRLLPISGLSKRSASRVIQGFCMMSQTSRRW